MRLSEDLHFPQEVQVVHGVQVDHPADFREVEDIPVVEVLLVVGKYPLKYQNFITDNILCR